MKNHRISSILLFLVSFLFYVSSIITFAGENNNSMGSLWLCLGSAFLCLGAALSRKEKENEPRDRESE